MLYNVLDKMRGKGIHCFTITLVVILVYLYANYTPVTKMVPSERTILQRNATVTIIPTLYLITATKKRLEQKADLTRFSQTLKLVRSLHWILVEDSENKTILVSNLLKRSHLLYTHLNVVTPTDMQLKKGENRLKHPRGLAQRNAGLSWIRENKRTPGVVYFADDDNTYDIRIFEEMRYTKKVSVWPVGLVAGLKFESPMCHQNGTISGWLTTYDPGRTFATDMAGFAVNVQLIHDNPNAQFRSKPGYLETDFISQLNIKRKDLEPMANNCKEVLVWHTRTERSSIGNEGKLQKMHGGKLIRNIEV